MSALLLLERGEGTSAAQSVTPLRADEYLASKVNYESINEFIMP